MYNVQLDSDNNWEKLCRCISRIIRHSYCCRDPYSGNLIIKYYSSNWGPVNKAKDDLMVLFRDFCFISLFSGYLRNLDQFLSRLSEESKFTPMGELLHSHSWCEKTYEVYKVYCSVSLVEKLHRCHKPFTSLYLRNYGPMQVVKRFIIQS